MAKVQCKELAGQPCTFAYVGTLQFDENGIVEITDEQLLRELSFVQGYRILPEPVAPAAPKQVVKAQVKEKQVAQAVVAPAPEPTLPVTGDTQS